MSGVIDKEAARHREQCALLWAILNSLCAIELSMEELRGQDREEYARARLRESWEAIEEMGMAGILR